MARRKKRRKVARTRRRKTTRKKASRKKRKVTRRKVSKKRRKSSIAKMGLKALTAQRARIDKLIRKKTGTLVPRRRRSHAVSSDADDPY